MKKQLILFTLSALFAFTPSMTASAQETTGKKTFSLEDLIPGGKNYSSLRPENKRFYFDGEKCVEGTKEKGPDKFPYKSFTRENNLFVSTADGKEIQVTDEPKGVVCGQSVHRNEFGINGGTFWSPKGNLLAFYRMDERMVTDYPQIDYAARFAELRPDKYPMAGMTSHVVSIGIFNPATSETVWLETGNTVDRYLTNVSWSPDEKKVYVIELNRDQNHSQLVRYDAATGAREAILIEETSEKYVEPLHPIVFLPWDDSQFIYQSQKDGYNHLYLYNTDGTLIRQLTKGEWVVENIVGFNTKKKLIIYQSRETSPLSITTWKVTLKGKRTLLGDSEGTHRIVLSESGNQFIDTYSKPDVPRRIQLVNVISGKSETLFEAADPWAEYDVPEITVGTLKAADGVTDLYYRLVKPTNFNPAEKYPAVVYVYGGPHAQNVSGGWNWDVRGWDIYMAQLGYVVFTLDNRGSAGRGLAFENSTFRHLGREEAKDQMEGVKLLQSLPFVDAERIGVHGWSFGGFMTITMMTTYPEVFKVGVAGGPVIDWKYYEVMYGERYMDTPQDNPDGYAESSLLNKAGKLKGKLQIIIGGNDDTVVPQHTMAFLRACIDAETQPDLFIYPAQGHNMVGRDRIHLHQRITQYFEDYLK
ncbi:MAG: S9 family peptidase [Bacteroidaceae bacterium]|nr:S9 family peptidase [Bacteroidaceae bacterium]